MTDFIGAPANEMLFCGTAMLVMADSEIVFGQYARPEMADTQ